MQGRYKIGTIARLSGFSPAVLRAWERRFDFLMPERLPSGHRLYTDDDLAVLRRVRSFLDAGRSIGEIARMGRPALVGASRVLAPGAGSPQREHALAEPSGGLEDTRDRIVAAAVAIDASSLRQAVDHAFAAVSPQVAIEEALIPAAYRIGELWAEGRCSVAGEHLASAVFRERLRRLVDEAEVLGGAGPVAVCGCLPDEAHEIGALVVAYRLVRLGVRAVYLGADLPLEDALEACRRTGAGHAFLSVSREALYLALRPSLRRFVERSQDACTFVIGGLGAPARDDDLEAAGVVLWPAERSLDELEALLLAAPSPAKKPVRRRKSTPKKTASRGGRKKRRRTG